MIGKTLGEFEDRSLFLKCFCSIFLSIPCYSSLTQRLMYGSITGKLLNDPKEDFFCKITNQDFLLTTKQNVSEQLHPF